MLRQRRDILREKAIDDAMEADRIAAEIADQEKGGSKKNVTARQKAGLEKQMKEREYLKVEAAEQAKEDKAMVEAIVAKIEAEDRAAFYVAVVVLLEHEDDPTPLIAEGRWHGRIATAPRGTGGFGYDPLFVAEGYEQHAAELSAEEKNRVSHRALAVQQLLQQLAA